MWKYVQYALSRFPGLQTEKDSLIIPRLSPKENFFNSRISISPFSLLTFSSLYLDTKQTVEGNPFLVEFPDCSPICNCFSCKF